jgi:hypothetical protein
MAKPEPACVDEFIGPKLRAQGITCPCPAHRQQQELPYEEDPKPRRVPQDAIRDGSEKKED